MNPRDKLITFILNDCYLGMADVHTSEIRSFNMSRIKSKDTKPEILVRKFLHKNGFRYKFHDKTLPGKPDIVLPKYKTVIFVNGCFWHGHENCKFFKIPKTRTEWWQIKINKNIINDSNAIKSLRLLGWKVVCIWECELNKSKKDFNLKMLKNTLLLTQ